MLVFFVIIAFARWDSLSGLDILGLLDEFFRCQESGTPGHWITLGETRGCLDRL